jgi:hypothetical protein
LVRRHLQDPKRYNLHLNLEPFQTFLEMNQELLIHSFANAFLQHCNIDDSYFDDEKKIKKIKYFFLELNNIYKKNKDY